MTTVEHDELKKKKKIPHRQHDQSPSIQHSANSRQTILSPLALSQTDHLAGEARYRVYKNRAQGQTADLH